MITLITGTPGAGKTLYMVSELAKNKEFQGRKVFVDGIKGLKLDNIEPFPDGCGVLNMHEWAKEEEYHGSVFVIDEAQRVFPPRSSNSKAPDLVEFLHVHRHFGLDIYLITQMPARIDKNVRDLVGAHYHIHKNPLGFRVKYYWDYCANNPRSEAKNGQRSVYRLDKSVFKLYESAQIHTKVKTPKSKVRWIIPAVLCGMVYFGMDSYKKLSGMAEKKESADKVAASPAAAGGGSSQDLSGAVSQQKQQLDESFKNVNGGYSLTLEMFKPTIPEMVESKPIYDGVRQVAAFEYATACIQNGKSCNCYSEQATKIREIGRDLCMEYVRDGLPFNPYKQKQQQQQENVQQVMQPESGSGSGGGSVLALSGREKYLPTPKFGDGPSAQ